MKFNDEMLSNAFRDFVRTGDQNSDIKTLYEALPYATSKQQQVLIMFRTYAERYNSTEFAKMADSLEELIKSNRKLGWTFKRNLEAISLFKHFNGYKASSSVSETKEG